MARRLRADQLLVKRGLVETRARAQAAISAGLALANGTIIEKPSQLIPDDAELSAGPAHPYVSRGGVKLAAALDFFGIDPKNRTCLDIGASTGGFTEVLINRGAKLVYAVDVGTSQLHASLRKHAAVRSMEKTDARALDRTLVPDQIDLLVADVSFISLKLILPSVLALMNSNARMVVLIKPQFEAGREHVRKGIIRDQAIHNSVCEDIVNLVTQKGWTSLGVIPSPIEGGDGNREFLLAAER